MKKQQELQRIIPGLILIALLLAIAYALFALQIELPAISFNQSFNQSFDQKEQPASNFQDPGDLMAYRWNAMAEAYERMGLLNDHDNPDNLMAYRWNAMAEAHERMGLLNYHDNPDDLMAYRWNAMAEAYERMGLLNLP